MADRKAEIAALQKDWDTNPRWKGIKRGYTAEDVVRLRGSLKIEHTLAKHGAERLWELVNNEAYINCLGALTGGQAMQQVKAGIQAIYLSGWQVAADGNSYAAMYPDQSLYPVDSVPKWLSVLTIHSNALMRFKLQKVFIRAILLISSTLLRSWLMLKQVLVAYSMHLN